MNSLSRVHLEKEKPSIQIIQQAETFPTDESSDSEQSEEYKNHQQNINEENQQFINSARRVNQNTIVNVLLSDEQLIQELRNRNIPLIQNQEGQNLAALQRREELMLRKMTHIQEQMQQMQRTIFELSNQLNNKLVQNTVLNQPQEQPKANRMSKNQPTFEIVAEESSLMLIQQEEQKEEVLECLKSKAVQNQSSIQLNISSLEDDFNSLESESCSGSEEEEQSQNLSGKTSSQSLIEKSSLYSFGPNKLFVEGDSGKVQDLAEELPNFKGLPLDYKRTGSFTSGQKKISMTQKLITKTKSFLATKSSSSLDQRNVDLQFESAEKSLKVDLIKNLEEESKGEDDFFTRFQQQMEASLLQSLPDIKLRKVPKVSAKKRKKVNQSQFQKRAELEMQNQDCVKSSPASFILLEKRVISDVPKINVSPLGKKDLFSIARISEVEDESQSQGSQSLESLCHLNCKIQTGKPMLRMPPSRTRGLESDDTLLDFESINRSEFTEDLNIENFNGPIKYSAEGIVTNNSLQKSIIDFCVKVGVDPKYYEELFQEISKIDLPLKPIVGKRPTQISFPIKGDDIIPIYRNQSENLQRMREILNDKTNGTQRSLAQGDEILQTKDSLDQKSLENLLRNNTSQFSQMIPCNGEKCRMNNIKTSILAKRIQSFYGEETQRVKQMNNLQAIIKKQNQQIATLLRQNKAEKKELHFAFMFACPLVLSFVANNSTKLQMVPQLNYRKEFQIIKHKLMESKAKVTITSQQCTIESLQDVLRQKPLGIHFSGHGIQNTFDNVGEFHYQQKNEGDFLLLETIEGDSKLVSRQKLQHLIITAKCKLDFVVVATCHSEFVGRIFLEAGAQHVVCINSSDEVADEAVLHFTSTFYSAVFQQKESICKAFEYAQLSVKINHNAKEASVFKLLLPHSKHTVEETDKKSIIVKDSHKCFVFGPFSLGTFTLREPYDVTFKLQTTRQTDLVGRQKDMYILITKIMSPLNHLITLMGLPGVGKSSLIKATMQYIQDRSLLRGGLIMTDARSISNCELLVRKLNNQFISENSAMFGSAKEHNQSQQQDCLSTFILIISKISYIREEILLVIDNCDELILQDRQNFKVLISTILATVSSIKIVLTTRIRLGQGINEANEEIFVLSGITNTQTSQLLKKKVNRPITQAEQNALMKIIPDYEKYPCEKGLRPNELFEHHLFKLLGGNPQSIMLVAPLLNDPNKKIKLADLYKMLTSNQLCEMLKSEEIEDAVMASLRISVQISVQEINESDPISMQFFFLLGQLPGGIEMKDLETIWNYIQQTEVSEKEKLKRIMTAGCSNSQKSSKMSDLDSAIEEEMPWKIAINQLEFKHLIESHSSETMLHARLKKTSNIDILSDNEEQQSSSDKSSEDTANNTNSTIQMPHFVRNFAEAMIEPNELQFFQEVLSNYFFRKLFRLYDQSEIKGTKGKQFQRKILSVINSLEQNMDAFIQRMSDKHGLKLVKTNQSSPPHRGRSSSPTNRERPSSPSNGARMGMLHPQSDVQIIGEKRFPFQKLQKQNSFSQVINQEEQKSSPILFQKKNETQLWSKLFENYQQILGEREKYTQELMTRYLTIKPKRANLSKQEWVIMMWRWAFNIVQKKIQQQKKGDIIARSKTFQVMTSSFHLKNPEINEVLEQNQDKEDSESRFARLEKVSAVAFTKGGLKKMYKSEQKLDAFVSQQNDKKKMAESMSGEEMTVLYYIADLILISRICIVKTICEKHLILMNKASSLFKANVTRYLAFCLMEKCEFDGRLDDEARIMSLLEDSYEGFQNSDCNWGMGLAKYMMGKFYFQFIELSNLSKTTIGDQGINNYSFVDSSNPIFQSNQSPEEYDKESTIIYFLEALSHFEQIHHFRGIVESGKYLMNLYELQLKAYQNAYSARQLQNNLAIQIYLTS